MIRVAVHRIDSGWLAELIDTEPLPRTVYDRTLPTFAAAAELCQRAYDLMA